MQQIGILELVCSGMWFCFPSSLGILLQVFFLLCKVHDGSHSKKAEAKEVTLLGLSSCPLGGPIGTERYVPDKGIKRSVSE